MLEEKPPKKNPSSRREFFLSFAGDLDNLGGPAPKTRRVVGKRACHSPGPAPSARGHGRQDGEAGQDGTPSTRDGDGDGGQDGTPSARDGDSGQDGAPSSGDGDGGQDGTPSRRDGDSGSSARDGDSGQDGTPSPRDGDGDGGQDGQGIPDGDSGQNDGENEHEMEEMQEEMEEEIEDDEEEGPELDMDAHADADNVQASIRSRGLRQNIPDPHKTRECYVQRPQQVLLHTSLSSSDVLELLMVLSKVEIWTLLLEGHILLHSLSTQHRNTSGSMLSSSLDCSGSNLEIKFFNFD